MNLILLPYLAISLVCLVVCLIARWESRYHSKMAIKHWRNVDDAFTTADMEG